IMRMMLTNEEEEYRIYNISSYIQWDRNGRPENIYGIVNDITEITKYNHKVEELRKGMQMALDAGKVSTWRFDKEKNTVHVLYGHHLTGGIMTMEEYYSYVHVDDKEIFPSALDSILKGEADNLEVNFRLNPSGNGYRWYSCCLMPVYEDKEIKYVIGTRRDVTEEIDYRIELEENHKILQNILDKVPTPVYIVDPELDTVVYANNQCETVFGIKKGVNSGMVYRRDLSKICIAKNNDLLRTGGDYSANELLVFRNGEIRYTHVNKIVIAFNNKNLILTARVDLTEQEQLSIAKKLITVSLPGFNAYTWSVDGRNNKMYYNVLGGNNVANINHIDTIDEFTSLIHTEDRESCKQTLSSYIKKGDGEFCMIYRIRYGDNESFQWWETRGIAELLEDKNGKHTVLYGISINITSQKLNELSLKESQMKLLEINRQNELILNNSSSGIVYVDCDGKVLWSNLLSVEGLCFPITEFYSGCGCEHFLGCNKMCHECPIKVHNNSGEVWCREVDLEDNGIFNILATPIKGEHGVEGTVLRIDNITERAMMISDLEAAKEKAEESERLKMAFLANMSHEIRTPLNAIVGFSELLQETVDENEKKEFINIINYNNDLLLRLIGDILDLSKIESGTIDLKLDEFDFSLALREQYHSWQQRDCDNGIEFIFEDPYESCVISHDKNRLIQVCMNFLSNAFKYTKYGTITLGYIYENGGLKMYVKDTGIGIASNKHHLIFNRFAKLDDFAQGTGLGLTICKAIVETCGGKIGFESKQNVGSYFWAWFPCQAKEIVDNKMGRKLQMDSETENVVDKINLSNNMHILVAEDNESNYLLVKAILKNYNITRVNNGADAVKCARENTYDAILMDVNMPIMSGIEATQKIRLFNPTIPIIAFTANAFDADRYAARAAGFSAFIAKPIRKKQLERTLSRITEISIVDCDDYWE
ncbi:MAG: response regulator, partial [Marinifilaceae bacterium]